MISLPEFLLARVSEDEASAQAVQEGVWCVSGEVAAEDAVKRLGNPARVLAECEAKRRIVEQYQEAVVDAEAELDMEMGWVKDGVVEALATSLRILALPCAEHPDFREEWKA